MVGSHHVAGTKDLAGVCKSHSEGPALNGVKRERAHDSRPYAVLSLDQEPYQVNPSSFEPSEFASILDDALSS